MNMIVASTLLSAGSSGVIAAWNGRRAPSWAALVCVAGPVVVAVIVWLPSR